MYHKVQQKACGACSWAQGAATAESRRRPDVCTRAGRRAVEQDWCAPPGGDCTCVKRDHSAQAGVWVRHQSQGTLTGESRPVCFHAATTKIETAHSSRRTLSPKSL